MLFTIDVGNSNIVAGIWRKGILERSWRIHTVAEKTKDEYTIIFRSLFQDASLDPRGVRQICLSSVVPSLTSAIADTAGQLCDRKVMIVGPNIYERLPITVVNPYEVGADLVADAMAAYDLCQGACVIVDFGTALTFTIVDGKGVMTGVAIAPGLMTAVNALSRDTAQLPFVRLEAPPEPFGRNTVHAIQAGVIYGYTGLVEYMVKRIKETIALDIKVVATGGLCGVLSPLTKVFDHIDPDLTLRGLRLIAERISV